MKTSVAVCLCMIVFNLIHRENPFFACIAAVFCMKDTVSNSIHMGKNRIIGTIIGGIIGILLIYLSTKFTFLYSISPIVTGIGISISIYIFTLLKKPESVIVSCIVISGIMINYSSQINSYIYAVNRSIDTIIGIIIAILVNKLFKPIKIKKNSPIDS
ncbi:aromatic acid exporter family protein [uncultured Clostridium sp.]|uniref:FUSC family protein n=1 Tax=uncultured Clostridium sp. TaxID=59620 RepID=UPI0025CD9AC7|nr:aromatic acid exporter family protein [uncultured Clostridium sp.]